MIICRDRTVSLVREIFYQHLVTGSIPYFLMFGRHHRLPIDYQMRINRDNLAEPFKFNFVNKLNERLSKAYAEAEALAQQEANR